MSACRLKKGLQPSLSKVEGARFGNLLEPEGGKNLE
jgi:hypothetical protein